MDADKLAKFTADVLEGLKLHDHIEVSPRVMLETFRQPERESTIGSALMDFAGLPDEKENRQRWARANRLDVTFDPGKEVWRVTETLAAGFMYGPREYQRNYSGLRAEHERVLLINRDGFEKRMDIDSDVLHWRVPRVVRISAFNPVGVLGDCVQELMLFNRTRQRSPDGLAIFRENGFE